MKISAEQIAAKIGIPLDDWAGNCHGIATAIVDADALRSYGGPDTQYRVARGHWVGPMAPEGYYGYHQHLPFAQHSWIQAHGLLVPREHNQPLRIDQEIEPLSLVSGTIHNPIIDPTRFAFDGQAPYVYIGENDYYDEGGNMWRMANEPTLLPFDPSKPRIALVLPGRTQEWIWRQLEEREAGRDYPYGWYNYALVMWLANLSLDMLGRHAEPIFRAIVEAGHGAAIPIDNRRMVLG